MNITYFLGNGFDINLKLKTRYQDFYTYYCKQQTDSLSIKKLKDKIQGYLVEIKEEQGRTADEYNWADLEEAFGQYTKEINTFDELRLIFYDLNAKLKQYLKEQEKLFFNNYTADDKIMTDLVSSYKYYRSEESDIIKRLFPDTDNNVGIITFNYTHSIEQLVQYKGTALRLGNNFKGRIHTLTSINHVHGTLEDVDLILGVNDKSQIANSLFSEDEDATDFLIKPQTNDMLDIHRNESYRRLIESSGIIVIFGISFGVTDTIWWQYLKKHLDDTNCLLLWFVNDGNVTIEHESDRWRTARKLRKELLVRLGYKEEEFKKFDKRIFVGFNTDMFKLTTSQPLIEVQSR